MFDEFLSVFIRKQHYSFHFKAQTTGRQWELVHKTLSNSILNLSWINSHLTKKDLKVLGVNLNWDNSQYRKSYSHEMSTPYINNKYDSQLFWLSGCNISIKVHRSKDSPRNWRLVVSKQHDNMYMGDQAIMNYLFFVKLSIFLFSSSGYKYDPDQDIHWSKPNVSDKGILKLPLQLC